MNLRLGILRTWVPQFVKKRKLVELAAITANAFGVEAPRLRGLSFSDSLQTYALFTRAEANKVTRRNQDSREIRERLFNNALGLGTDLRRALRISSQPEFMRACATIYSMIGIDFRPDIHGQATVPKCYFSRYYSGAICRLISALDEGLVAGLSGGGRLSFYQRITEGYDCCRAHLALPGAES